MELALHCSVLPFDLAFCSTNERSQAMRICDLLLGYVRPMSWTHVQKAQEKPATVHCSVLVTDQVNGKEPANGN
jgi:hypothetical protein